jgi:hypothetical protein
MELFIQIRDGQPYEHPIFADNFQQAFPHIDANNLPPKFARFERIPQPTPGVYEVVEGPVYQWVDGMVKDVWTVRPMTDAEREVKTQQLIDGAYSMRDFFKTLAQQKIDEATTDQARQVWTGYLAQLDAYTVTDPLNPQVPMPPRIDKDGNVLSTTAPGSAPDVTG